DGKIFQRAGDVHAPIGIVGDGFASKEIVFFTHGSGGFLHRNCRATPSRRIRGAAQADGARRTRTGASAGTSRRERQTLDYRSMQKVHNSTSADAHPLSTERREIAPR